MSTTQLLPLKRFVDPRRPITYGIVQAGENEPTGVRYIRPVDMGQHDGVRDVSRLLRTSPEVARAYKRSELEAGDIVVSIGPSYGKTMLVDDELTGANLTQGTARVAVDHGNFAPYVRWALRSTIASASWDAAVGGATFRALNLEPLGETPIPTWPVEAQRAISDYLDRKTARIDALITAKRRMVELLEERWQEILETVIWGDVTCTTRLMHAVDLRRQVTYGIVLPGPDVGGDGIPIVKGGDVAQRRLSPEMLCRTTPEIEAPYARARLRGGDLVFAIRGGIGDVAVVPDALTGANLTQDVARVAPRTGTRSEWLTYALQSPTVQRDVRRRVTGATITGLNIWELERVRIPMASPERQEHEIEELNRVAEHLHKMGGALNRQIDLLRERQQSLITGAVTGQLEIPGAS